MLVILFMATGIVIFQTVLAQGPPDVLLSTRIVASFEAGSQQHVCDSLLVDVSFVTPDTQWNAEGTCLVEGATTAGTLTGHFNNGHLMISSEWIASGSADTSLWFSGTCEIVAPCFLVRGDIGTIYRLTAHEAVQAHSDNSSAGARIFWNDVGYSSPFSVDTNIIFVGDQHDPPNDHVAFAMDTVYTECFVTGAPTFMFSQYPGVVYSSVGILGQGWPPWRWGGVQGAINLRQTGGWCSAECSYSYLADVEIVVSGSSVARAEFTLFSYRSSQDTVVTMRLVMIAGLQHPDSVQMAWRTAIGMPWSYFDMYETGNLEYEARLDTSLTSTDSIQYMYRWRFDDVCGWAWSEIYTAYPYWELRRHDDPEEPFKMDRDAWAFGNDCPVWPYPPDPNDPWHPDAHCDCPPADGIEEGVFPSWALFRGTFGADQVEYDVLGYQIPRPNAYLLWRNWAKCWGGSCYGFATSAFLEFGGFNSLGSGNGLYGLGPINDAWRNVVNSYQLYQRGVDQQTHRASVRNNTPNQTLEELKAMMSSTAPLELKTMDIGDTDAQNTTGWHAVNPIRVWRTGRDTYTIDIYDNSNPSAVQQIALNTQGSGTWDYNPNPQWSWHEVGKNMFLRPVTLATVRPLLPGRYQFSALTEGVAPAQIYLADASDYVITNTMGQVIEWQGGALSVLIPEADPIIFESGGPDAPIGYNLPLDDYAVSQTLVTGEFDYATFHGVNAIFDATRADTEPDQTNLYAFSPSGDSLRVDNPDSVLRSYQFKVVMFEADSGERVVDFNAWTLAQDDYAVLLVVGESVAIDNPGAARPFDYHIQRVGNGYNSELSHTGGEAPENCRLIVAPDWSDTSTYGRILIDILRDGTIDDTLWVENQITPPSAPTGLVILVDGMDVHLRWNRVAGSGMYYHVYSDSLADGLFQNLIGTTTDTLYVDSGAAATTATKFYGMQAVKP